MLIKRPRRDRKPPTQAIKLRSLVDFWTFVDMIGFRGGHDNFSDIHDEIADWGLTSNSGLKQLLLCFRGSLKSTIMSVARTLWRIYQNPNIRIFVGTNVKGLSKAFVREIKTYLEDGWLIKYVWNVRPHFEGPLIPTMASGTQTRRRKKAEEDEVGGPIDTEAEDRKIIWNAESIQVVRPETLKEPTVTVGAVGAAPTGFHYDEVIFDDVVDFDNCSTPDRLARVYSWVYDIQSVLDPCYFDQDLHERVPKTLRDKFYPWCISGGRITVIGTRYAPKDYYDEIIEKQQELGYVVFERNIYKNGVDNSDGYTWPEKWDSAYEEEIRASVSAVRFASQYLNKIITDEDIILNPENIVWMAPHAIVKVEESGIAHIRLGGIDAPIKVVRLNLMIDPAASTSTESDFTAMAVGGVDIDKVYYIVDAKLGKWRPNEIVNQAYELMDKWHLNRFYIEAYGAFANLKYTFQESFSTKRAVVILEHRATTFVGEGKYARIVNTLEPLFANQRLCMAPHIKANKEAMKQLEYIALKSVKDDFPDVVQQVVELSKPVPVSSANRKGSRSSKYNRRYGGYR